MADDCSQFCNMECSWVIFYCRLVGGPFRWLSHILHSLRSGHDVLFVRADVYSRVAAADNQHLRRTQRQVESFCFENFSLSLSFVVFIGLIFLVQCRGFCGYFPVLSYHFCWEDRLQWRPLLRRSPSQTLFLFSRMIWWGFFLQSISIAINKWFLLIFDSTFNFSIVFYFFRNFLKFFKIFQNSNNFCIFVTFLVIFERYSVLFYLEYLFNVFFLMEN